MHSARSSKPASRLPPSSRDGTSAPTRVSRPAYIILSNWVLTFFFFSFSSLQIVLQARLFTYGSAARYRLTINFHQLKVNKPLYERNPTKRDGILYQNHNGLQPNYIARDRGTPPAPNDADVWTGSVQGFESSINPSDFDQPRELWKRFMQNPPMAKNFISNVASNLCMAIKCVRERTYGTCFGLWGPWRC